MEKHGLTAEGVPSTIPTTSLGKVILTTVYLHDVGIVKYVCGVVWFLSFSDYMRIMQGVRCQRSGRSGRLHSPVAVNSKIAVQAPAARSNHAPVARRD